METPASHFRAVLASVLVSYTMIVLDISIVITKKRFQKSRTAAACREAPASAPWKRGARDCSSW
jgi:hypothetical protein